MLRIEYSCYTLPIGESGTGFDHVKALNAHPRRIPEPGDLRGALCGRGAVLVHVTSLPQARAEHADDPAALGLRGLFVHRYDVQFAAPGRDHRARSRRGNRGDRAWSLG